MSHWEVWTTFWTAFATGVVAGPFIWTAGFLLRDALQGWRMTRHHARMRRAANR